MIGRPSDFDDWIKHADLTMLERYGIDLNDAGPSEEDLRRFSRSYPHAPDFVEWWGLKYDLDPLDDYYARKRRFNGT